MANSRPGQPIELTYGQTILWLLKHRIVHSGPLVDYEDLYLIGPQPSKQYQSRRGLDALLKKRSDGKYKMADAQNVFLTSEDPVRRYFETHLAWHTLCHGLEDMPLSMLLQLRDALHRYTNQVYVDTISLYLDDPQHKMNGILQEYGDIYRAVENSTPPFDQLNDKEKTKLFILIQCMALSFLIAQEENPTLPIPIYNVGFYEDCHRGRIPRAEGDIKKTRHYGLIRPHAPLARFELAEMPKENEHSKSSERMTFDRYAHFPRFLFSYAVHPFVTSISGSLLFHLRVLKHLGDNHLFRFASADTLIPWLQCLTSLLLFYPGGHSLFEFMAVFEFSAMQEAFYFVSGFNEINLKSVFRDKNRYAFATALYETMQYQTHYLHHLELQQELIQHPLKRARNNILSCLFALNEYKGSNKASLVEAFKREVSANLPAEETLEHWEETINITRNALKRLKHGNEIYYTQLSLFSHWRQGNSTLTTCIANAEKALQQVTVPKNSK